MTITIYTIPTCPWCTKAKKYLYQKKLKVNEKDIVNDDYNRKEMMEKSGQMGVPVIDIDGKIIVGFDVIGMDKALNKRIKDKKHLSRIYKGKEVLCNSCKTKNFQTVTGYPKEEFGCIVMHKKECAFLKKLLKNSVEV